jgi:hypothetical protein
MNYVAKHLKEFMSGDTFTPSTDLKNVGKKTSTDPLFSNQYPEKKYVNAGEEMTAFELKMNLLDVSAIICLRLVMKFAENQLELLTPSIANYSSNLTENSSVSRESNNSEVLISANQHILDKIVASINQSRNFIWGPDFGLSGIQLDAAQRNELILELINCFV